MIRVAIFLILLALIALGVTWIADRPGEVAITWHGWRIETSLMVTAVAVVLLVAVSILLWSLLRGILRSPLQFSSFWQRRRGNQGFLAITRGLIAVGAGDTRAAQKYSGEAERLVSSEPLALLLGAQSAQLAGDRAAAERSFRKMAAHDDTRLLGLRGLFIEAQRRDDLRSAGLYAEEAARIAPSLPWAGQAVLQLRCATGDWAGALDILDRNRKSGAFDKTTHHRQRAVLLTARALTAEDKDRDAAKIFVFEAVKLAPDLVPAAALAGRFLAEAGDLRRAMRIVEKAWQASQHPDLAETYAHLRLGDSTRERLMRVKRLVDKGPAGIESALAFARAAVDAREFVLARETLAPHLAQPTQRVALLMAELERSEQGDEGRAREWTARAVHAARDPAWTADGFVSERWMPVSPISGRIDAFEWKVPLAEIASERPEAVAESAAPALIDVIAESGPTEEPAAGVQEEITMRAAPVVAPEKPARGPRIARERREPVPEAVVPVVHAPDDPGPDSELERDPVAEVSAPAPASGWRRIFSW